MGGVLWSVYTCGLAYLVETALLGHPMASIVIAGLVTTAALAAIFFIADTGSSRTGPTPQQGPARQRLPDE